MGFVFRRLGVVVLLGMVFGCGESNVPEKYRNIKFNPESFAEVKNTVLTEYNERAKYYDSEIKKTEFYLKRARGKQKEELEKKLAEMQAYRAQLTIALSDFASVNEKNWWELTEKVEAFSKAHGAGPIM